MKQRVLVNFGNIDNWPPERLKRLVHDLRCYAGLSYSADDIDPRKTLLNRLTDPKSKLGIESEWIGEQYIPGVNPKNCLFM